MRNGAYPSGIHGVVFYASQSHCPESSAVENSGGLRVTLERVVDRTEDASMYFDVEAGSFNLQPGRKLFPLF
jgi:hypothetical protein